MRCERAQEIMIVDFQLGDRVPRLDGIGQRNLALAKRSNKLTITPWIQICIHGL
jgi:hypothetical protein